MWTFEKNVRKDQFNSCWEFSARNSDTPTINKPKKGLLLPHAISSALSKTTPCHIFTGKRSCIITIQNGKCQDQKSIPPKIRAGISFHIIMSYLLSHLSDGHYFMSSCTDTIVSMTESLSIFYLVSGVSWNDISLFWGQLLERDTQLKYLYRHPFMRSVFSASSVTITDFDFTWNSVSRRTSTFHSSVLLHLSTVTSDSTVLPSVILMVILDPGGKTFSWRMVSTVLTKLEWTDPFYLFILWLVLLQPILLFVRSWWKLLWIIWKDVWWTHPMPCLS